MMKSTSHIIFFCSLLGLAACGGPNPTIAQQAEVKSVTIQGDPGHYTFTVTVRSPDKGCGQYADWWEVITADGDLIYRRILLHSHVSEQPFTRSGGPVEVTEEQELIIRAHMNNAGFGEKAITGTVKDGFTKVALDKDFAEDLEKEEPLPDGCAF